MNHLFLCSSIVSFEMLIKQTNSRRRKNLFIFNTFKDSLWHLRARAAGTTIVKVTNKKFKTWSAPIVQQIFFIRITCCIDNKSHAVQNKCTKYSSVLTMKRLKRDWDFRFFFASQWQVDKPVLGFWEKHICTVMTCSKLSWENELDVLFSWEFPNWILIASDTKTTYNKNVCIYKFANVLQIFFWIYLANILIL